MTIFNGVFQKLKVQISKPLVFAPEEFEACFKQMMEASLKKENCVVRVCKRAIEYVRRGETSITNLDKIVIVIDNIDRCHNTMAYQLLTDIKTFLGDEEYNVVFVIPVDDEALKKHLFDHTRPDDCSKDKEEFLRKFFNVTLRIKPHQPTEMLSFAHELNQKNSLGFSPDTLSLVAKEFATNPRRIIQLLNNLSSEITLYDEDFADKNEALICAILIIREEFPELYRKVLNDADLLVDAKKRETELKNDENARLFMQMAEATFRQANISDTLNVLTNTSSQFKLLPAEIRNAAGVDATAIVEYLSRNEGQEIIVNALLLDSLGTDCKYKSPAQLANWLDFLSMLHSKHPIGKAQLKLYDNRHNKHYESVLQIIKNTSEVCSYAQALEKAGLRQLKNAIIKYISEGNKDKNPPANYHTFVKSVLKSFNSETDSKSLSAFSEKYHSGYTIDKTIDYTENQKKYLFTDAHIVHTVKSIAKSEDRGWVEELLWLFENKPNIAKESFGEFFNHMDSLFGGTMNNKTKEEIVSYIQFLNPFLLLIDDFKLTSEPSVIYSKFFNPRSIVSGRNHYNQPQTTNIKLLDECKNNIATLDVIASFCCEIYRITGNHTDVREQLKTIYMQKKDTINSKFVALLQSGYPLSPLFEIILTDNSFSPDNSILTEHCLTYRNEDKARAIDANALEAKITTLVTNASNEQVAELLLRVNAVDPEIKVKVVAEIVTKDTGFINALPEALLDLAVQAFSKDTCAAYIANYPYLEKVAEKGNASQKSILVTALLQNFLSNKDVDDTIGVFEKIVIGNQKEKNLIHAQLDNYLETVPKEKAALRERLESLMKRFKRKEVIAV